MNRGSSVDLAQDDLGHLPQYLELPTGICMARQKKDLEEAGSENLNVKPKQGFLNYDAWDVEDQIFQEVSVEGVGAWEGPLLFDSTLTSATAELENWKCL